MQITAVAAAAKFAHPRIIDFSYCCATFSVSVGLKMDISKHQIQELSIDRLDFLFKSSRFLDLASASSA